MTTVEPGIKCNSCGGEIFPNAGEQSDGEWVHVDISHCYHVVSARVEAAEVERDTLVIRVKELAVMARLTEVYKYRFDTAYETGRAYGLSEALILMCGSDKKDIEEQYAQAGRKLKKLLGWQLMTDTPPEDGEYPVQTIHGMRDMIRYTRAVGWHFPRPSLLAGWFLLPPWPAEQSKQESEGLKR